MPFFCEYFFSFLSILFPSSIVHPSCLDCLGKQTSRLRIFFRFTTFSFHPGLTSFMGLGSDKINKSFKTVNQLTEVGA